MTLKARSGRRGRRFESSHPDQPCSSLRRPNRARLDLRVGVLLRSMILIEQLIN